MKLINLMEASERIGVSRQTLSNWCKSGVLKAHKISTKPNSIFVDEDTIDAMKDTMQDVEHTRLMLENERNEIQALYKEEHDVLRNLRDEVFMLKHCGKGLAPREFYVSVLAMMHDLGVLNERETTIMRRLLNGDSIQEISEDYGLTNTRISQIFMHACRKTRNVERIKKTLSAYDEAQKELDYFRAKAKLDANYIKDLEGKLDIECSPRQYASDREKEILTTRLVNCDLSIRTLSCLKRANIETIGDLLMYTKHDLLKFRNFGKKSLIEVDEMLESMCINWK